MKSLFEMFPDNRVADDAEFNWWVDAKLTMEQQLEKDIVYERYNNQHNPVARVIGKDALHLLAMQLDINKGEYPNRTYLNTKDALDSITQHIPEIQFEYKKGQDWWTVRTHICQEDIVIKENMLLQGFLIEFVKRYCIELLDRKDYGHTIFSDRIFRDRYNVKFDLEEAEEILKYRQSIAKQTEVLAKEEEETYEIGMF